MNVTKCCKKCKKEQPMSEYHKAKVSVDGTLHKCRSCCNEEKEIRRLKKVKLVQRYKLLCGCKDCGYNKHPVALSFDHLNPDEKPVRQKSRSAINYGWSISRIKSEIRKCEVVCVNCHHIRTYNDKQYNRINDKRRKIND